MFRKVVYIFCFLLSVSTVSFGQYYEVGGGIGLASYWGDLNVSDFGTNISNSGFSAEASLKYNFNGFIGVKTKLFYGNIKGLDKQSTVDWQIQRNLSFKSVFAELSILGEFTPFEYDAQSGEHMFSPFLVLGVSSFYFNPKTLYNGRYYALQPLGTEGQGISGYESKYSLISGSIVYGGGIKLRMSDVLNISFELLGRRTFTDYLDDVSGTYVDYNVLNANNGEMSAILANRANEVQDKEYAQLTGIRGKKDINDYMVSGMVTLSYNLMGRNALHLFKRKNKVSCPKM